MHTIDQLGNALRLQRQYLQRRIDLLGGIAVNGHLPLWMRGQAANDLAMFQCMLECLVHATDHLADLDGSDTWDAWVSAERN